MPENAQDYERSTVDFTAKVQLPQHVVYRVFVKETVVLNLKTGKYHGLNPTAGRILDVLQRSASIAAAVEKLAAEYEQPAERLAGDVGALCEQLLERNLIEFKAG
jgi:hypothetical protein